jgi:uncharacterized protein DUF5407
MPNNQGTFVTAPNDFGGGTGGQAQALQGFNVSFLFQVVNNATISAQSKLLQIQQRRSAISIGDMFEMQMLMNHLSQLSEMSTNVVSSANTAISSMARNVKS